MNQLQILTSLLKGFNIKYLGRTEGDGTTCIQLPVKDNTIVFSFDNNDKFIELYIIGE